MAKNDKILIDGIIDERIIQKLPSEKRDEAFEYFVFEQILKDYDLTEEEILLGSVDGRNDGGIDGFFILVNGHFLSDPESFNWPKSGSVLEIWIITCKHHDTFRQAPLDNLAASIVELLDFEVENTSLKGDYSEQVLRYRENLKLAYRKVSPRLSHFAVHFFYASRGDTSDMGDSIISRSKQITSIAKDAFGNSFSDFKFLGSTELIDLNRKIRNNSLEIPFVDDLSVDQTYVLLVYLKDYYSFIQDEGKLKRYLFDSNVRDFMGMNSVNEDIRATLANHESADFWWLNNGVTILATGASIIGKVIQIQDIQIVNGLQTSESIFRHFENGGIDPFNRSVLVKVIVSNDNKIRDAIIRATNNQTTVETSALHATDTIQRDIEDILKQYDFYYERRTNFYKNQGISATRIITPLYIASGFVSLALKEPSQASTLKSRFMRADSSYNKIFSPYTDLKVWPKIAYILKITDTFLETVRGNIKGSSENFLKNKRHLLSFITISRLYNSFNFSINDLIILDTESYSFAELQITWDFIREMNVEMSNRPKVKRTFLISVLKGAFTKWGIQGIERFKIYSTVNFDTTNAQIEEKVFDNENEEVTMEFALLVNELLPPQPWKPGTEKDISQKLNCTPIKYYKAVRLLIEEGLRFRQKDGVVYDQDGNVILFDEERVDATTLQLRK